MPQETTRDNSVLLTVARVAEMLSVHRETVYRLCAAGELDSIILSGTRARRIYATSVDDYLARAAGGAA